MTIEEIDLSKKIKSRIMRRREQINTPLPIQIETGILFEPDPPEVSESFFAKNNSSKIDYRVTIREYMNFRNQHDQNWENWFMGVSKHAEYSLFHKHGLNRTKDHWFFLPEFNTSSIAFFIAHQLIKFNWNHQAWIEKNHAGKFLYIYKACVK